MAWLGLWHYVAVIVLMMIGLYTVISRDNLVKKVMGLNIFQVSVIMFYVALGKVRGGTAPIISGTLEGGHSEGHDAGEAHGADAAHGGDLAHGADVSHAAEGAHDTTVCWTDVCPEGLYGMWDSMQQACVCAAYSNPLPHVLMLTAIVVGVATTALGLALVVRIQDAYGTVEEDEIVRMDRESA
jgi:multicomponent Na+:H+ antiporter subunit C